MSSMLRPKKRERDSPLAHSDRQRPVKDALPSLPNLSATRAKSSCPPPSNERVRSSPPTPITSERRSVKRARVSSVRVPVARARTSFFTLPRELRQAILVQAIDFAELHDCARRYRDRSKLSWHEHEMHNPIPFLACQKKHLEEILRLYGALMDIKAWNQQSSWIVEVGFVRDTWFMETKKTRGLAFAK